MTALLTHSLTHSPLCPPFKNYEPSLSVTWCFVVFLDCVGVPSATTAAATQ